MYSLVLNCFPLLLIILITHPSPLFIFPFPGVCSSFVYFGGFIIPLSISFLFLLSLDFSLFCFLNNCCTFVKVSEDLSAPGNSPLFSVLLTGEELPFEPEGLQHAVAGLQAVLNSFNFQSLFGLFQMLVLHGGRISVKGKQLFLQTLSAEG